MTRVEYVIQSQSTSQHVSPCQIPSVTLRLYQSLSVTLKMRLSKANFLPVNTPVIDSGADQVHGSVAVIDPGGIPVPYPVAAIDPERVSNS